MDDDWKGTVPIALCHSPKVQISQSGQCVLLDLSGRKLAQSIMYTKIGERHGINIAVATDSLGSQVIIGGADATNPVHRLSEDQGSYEAAIKLGQQVLAEGFDVTEGWLNLRKENLLMGMIRICSGKK